MDNLKKRQKQIYMMIKGHIEKNGYPPTVREIAKQVGLKSISTVHGHLVSLEELGYIRRNPSMSRAIEIVQSDAGSNGLSPNISAQEMVHVPVIGRITAGLPIEAIENVEESYPLPLSLVKSKDAYMLEVMGDSMIEAGILDGDLAIVEKRNTALNGEIVVAMLENNEVTVKRFYKEKSRFRLQPENPVYDPIYADRVDILGKVIGIYRDIH